MTLVKYKNNLDPIFTGFNHFFDDFITRDVPAYFPKGSLPKVNILENDNQFEIQLSAAGISKDDLNVKVDNDQLTISYDHKEDKSDEGVTYTMREFGLKSFSRSFNLPDTVDSSKIKANFVNGILILEIPKKEEAKPRPVQNIKIG